MTRQDTREDCNRAFDTPLRERPQQIGVADRVVGAGRLRKLETLRPFVLDWRNREEQRTRKIAAPNFSVYGVWRSNCRQFWVR